MATMLQNIPIAQPPAGARNPIFSARPYETGGVYEDIPDGVFVKINNDGSISQASTNPSGSIVGITQHDSYDVFDQFVGPPQGVPVTGQGVFGSTQETNTTSGGLVPGAPGETLVATLGAPVVVEINLTTATGWITGGTYQANIGTSVGLAKVTVAGQTVWVADPNGSNKVATISGKPTGPGRGVAGDLAARVFITMNAAALAAVQGR